LAAHAWLNGFEFSMH